MAPPRRRLSRDARRDQLLDTAEELFASAGYDTTTMDEIARAAGVTRAIVYAHFDNKEALLRAGVVRARAELATRLESLHATARDLPVSEVVRRGGEIFFSLLQDTPSRWALMFASALAMSESTARALEELRRETILQIIDIATAVRAEASRDQIEATAYAISGIGEQLGRWWLTRPNLDRDVIVDYYADIIVNGISRISPRPEEL